jgi:hypothetical protein
MTEGGERKPDMKKMLVFFLRFIAFSLILYMLWIFAGRYYTLLIAWVAKPLAALTGNELDVESTLKVTEDISLNPVVYLSLLAAVTGVPLRDRIKPAIIGLIILTAANVLTVLLMVLSAATGSESLWTGTEFLNLTINFFLHVLLWLLLAPKGNLLINPSSD